MDLRHKGFLAAILALDPIGDTPAEFARYLRAEAQKWGKLVKSAGIKAE